MKQKFTYPLFALSATNMLLRALLQGLIPLYPFIMGKLHATSSEVGLFLSLSYVFLFSGTYLAGVIIPRYVKPKKILLISMFFVALSIGGYGIAKSSLAFEIYGCAGSFFVGLQVCANNIMLGYYSTSESVGKNFGALSISSLLATILGGLTIGPVIAWVGEREAFYIFMGILLLCIFLFSPLRDPDTDKKKVERSAFKIDKNILLLLLTVLLASMLIYAFKMSISILLRAKGWNIRDISLLMAGGTAMALPLILLWGRICKYKNARTLLTLTLLCGAIAFASLYAAGLYMAGLIGFCGISMVAYSIHIPLMSMLFNWYDKLSLPKAQSLYNSAIWVSAIIGFAVNGIAIERLRHTVFISIGIFIALTALIPLWQIKMSNSNENLN